jgi:hypothetical protein
VNDSEDTHPTRIPHCSFCQRPYTSHAEGCEAVKYEESVRRHNAARAHFDSLSKLQWLLVLGIGARNRGAWLHYKGKVF